MILDVGRLSTQDLCVLCLVTFCRVTYIEMEVPLYCVLWYGCAYVGRGCRVSPNASPDCDLGMGKQPKTTIKGEGKTVCVYGPHISHWKM